MQFTEGKRIKAVEGVPVKEEEMLKEVEKDVEKGEKRNGSSKRWGKKKVDEKSAPEVSSEE